MHVQINCLVPVSSITPYTSEATQSLKKYGQRLGIHWIDAQLVGALWNY